MSDALKYGVTLPPEQQAIRYKCFHPSGTFVEFPFEEVESSIPARFEKIVRLLPDRTAVRAKNEQLSYIELNSASNRFAQAILMRYGEKQEPVGLFLPNSIDFVIAFLAILKVGKIAVPMNPGLVAGRLAARVKDSRAEFLVTTSVTFTLAKSLMGASRCLNVDDIDATETEASPSVSLSPDSLASIIYTTGSTGEPKGVIVSHRDVLHHVMRDTNEFHICAEDKLTFAVSSGRDVFRAVLNGASIHPVDILEEGFAGLARRLLQEQITIFNCVASAFRNFAGTLSEQEQFLDLRLIMFTGETVYKNDVALYQQHCSDASVLVNNYGPNGTGRISQYLMDKNTVIASDLVPVGYAVAGKQILLIDGSGNRVGPGVPGEIVVKSHHIHAGYWQRPEQTDAAFSIGPSDDQSRIYYTGDMGLMNDNGCLMHLGRTDFQFKIRGNKVELAAVEATLFSLESVQEAVVTVAEDDPADPRLIAYIVPQNWPAPTASAIRDALTSILPEYMVPSMFVFLDRLPLTGIGKVDRKALPTPGQARPQLDVPYIAPKDDLEAKLAFIWAEVLRLETVGMRDNFFHLGGHSLAASRIIAGVLQTFQLELPVKALFDAPTVAGMAAVIASNGTPLANSYELECMLREVEVLTDEEVQTQLAHQSLDGDNK